MNRSYRVSIILKASVESQISAQSIGAPRKLKNTQPTNKVDMVFLSSLCTPMAYTSYLRSTEVFRIILCLCMLLIAVNSTSNFAQDPQNHTQPAGRILPNVWLETETNKIFSQIDLRRSEFEKDQNSLQKFLYNKVIPFWNTRLMAKRLGGSPYRHASDALKKELEEQWKLTLVRYFLKAMSYYDKQRFTLDDDINCPSKNRCWLRTHIPVAGQKTVALDFYARWSKRSSNKYSWQVIDLRIAGVSLLKHKRGETRELLKQSGIKGLIAALKKKNDKVLLASTESGS